MSRKRDRADKAYEFAKAEWQNTTRQMAIAAAEALAIPCKLSIELNTVEYQQLAGKLLLLDLLLEEEEKATN